MNNTRKYMKYLLPIVLLPMFSLQINTLYSLATNTHDVQAEARNLILKLKTIESCLLFLIAIAVLSVSTLFSEKNKPKAAKIVHLAGGGYFVLQFTLLAVIEALCPRYTMECIFAPEALLTFGVPYLRIFAIVSLSVAIISGLISQLSGKHSFILIMSMCAGLCGICSFVNTAAIMLNLPLSFAAVLDALSFTAAYVMPFLMVPVKSYSKAFAPSIPE